MKIHFHTLQGIRWERQLPSRGNHNDEVHIWSHTLHYDDPFLREAPYILSKDELMRAQKYHFEKDKRIYESGHVFIRKVLSHYTSIDPAALVLSPVVNQKPKLENAPFIIHFNISHSGSKIVVAVGFKSDVGVDVEKILTDFDTDGFAEANYHPNELKQLQTLDGNEETEYFYTIWTRKEAWLKLTGEGINDKLIQLDFSGDNTHPGIPPHGIHNLYMTSWKESDDYMVTLASNTADRNILFYESTILINEMIL